jgi:peptide/nickel transport system substrate-binding protein
MDEQALRYLKHEVEVGRLSRRRFIQTLVGLGLTAPMAAQVLGRGGVAHAQP